jgi:Protein of unknown function (DUF3043)
VFRRSRPAAEDPSSYDGAEDADAAIPGDDGVARSPAITAGKGKPTPKRSDAERRRRQPYTAPKDRKEAGRASRDRQRADRGRRLEAVRRGEEWALPARDRGPVKALARDYVDSKRRLSEFYMYGLLVLLALVFVRTPVAQSILDGLVIVGVLIMLAEGTLIGRRVRALAAERLPGVSTRGVALYSAMRALQIRKLRMPRPRVNIGDRV